MKKSILIILCTITFSLSSCKDDLKNLKDGLYAKIETSKGNIIIELEYTKAPTTVANFVSLAEGNNPFVSENFKNKSFYDGLVFHRVEKGFVIQGGDPYGNGSGDPGYVFNDEITDLTHNKPGTLSMANSGSNTNGSQFFITLEPTPFLNGKHTVFGYVVEGMDVVNSIEVNDEMKKITIFKKGETAKKFFSSKVFNDNFIFEKENKKRQDSIDIENKKIYNKKYNTIKKQKALYFENLKKTAQKTSSRFMYKITNKTTSNYPEKGTTVYINYAGFLEDGTLFDTSESEIAKEFGVFDQNRELKKGYAPLPYEMGSRRMIPGFIEGLEKMKFGEKAVFFIPSNLGYGEQGAGDIIPPNANLIFEVELL